MFGKVIVVAATSLLIGPVSSVVYGDVNLIKGEWNAREEFGAFAYDYGNRQLKIELAARWTTKGYLMMIWSEPPRGGQSASTVECLRQTLTKLKNDGCDLGKITSLHFPQLFDDDIRHLLARGLAEIEPNHNRWASSHVWIAAEKNKVFAPYTKVFKDFNLEVYPDTIEKTLLLKENVSSGDDATKLLSNSADPDLYFHVRPLKNLDALASPAPGVN